MLHGISSPFLPMILLYKRRQVKLDGELFVLVEPNPAAEGTTSARGE